MVTDTIRAKYLQFFAKLEHEVVPSSPLVPSKYDPTLLFTNAGMNQFKDVFLGKQERSYTRACSSQKCLRVSGKHNDLEQVGFTARHHTFFEMLGNFSFGDYFKKEAIAWAWELVTSKDWFGIAPALLYVTVLKDDGLGLVDEEARSFWLETGIREGRIHYFDRKDNFWQMGDTGPCGPCSEIHIDRREQLGDKLAKPAGKICDDCAFANGTYRKCRYLETECERYSELWNLVFPQYNMQPDGSLQDLDKPGVDTGAGLERFAAVLQGVASNYDTDLFIPIIRKTQEIVGHSPDERELVPSFRVVADHARALAFAIADGVTFSNEGRGYVLRRILRRALRHGRQKLGYPEPFLHLLMATVVDIMGNTYPELKERHEYIEKLVRSEEESFSTTLDRGIVLFEHIVKENKKAGITDIGGDQAFRLYDTYGFPLDMTIVMAREAGLGVVEKEFDVMMDKHRERSRVLTKFQVEQSALAQANLQPTEFVGYSATRTEAKVLYCDESRIVLDATPFYAEAGGQVGDTGIITGANFEFQVEDTRRFDEVIVHSGRFTSGGLPKRGEPVTAQIDEERREAIARNHTATHLLQWALREVLGKHVKQSGSHVGPERLRFDFTHFEAMTKDQIREVHLLVNEHILGDKPVGFCELGYAEALKDGATAIFEEKYGDRVRMVEVGDYSKELCGGTHTRRTGEIGLFYILSETSIKAGVRRIEALTGFAAFEHLNLLADEFGDLRQMLRVGDSGEVVRRVADLLAKERELDKTREKQNRKAATKTANTLASKLKTEGGLRYAFELFDNIGRKELSTMADSFRAMDTPVAICLVSKKGDAVSAVVGASAEAVKNFNFDSGSFAREAGKLLGGSGGGRSDFGQAGGNDTSAVQSVEEAFTQTVMRCAGSRRHKSGDM
jgi:alanyl-tRNA synthetase